MNGLQSNMTPSQNAISVQYFALFLSLFYSSQILSPMSPSKSDFFLRNKKTPSSTSNSEQVAPGYGAHFCEGYKPSPPGEYTPHKPVHIKNANIWTGLGDKFHGEILIEDGRISQIGKQKEVEDG